MIEIIGYMVAAYGVARLLQVVFEKDATNGQQVMGGLGAAALVLLALWLNQQGDELSQIGGL